MHIDGKRNVVADGLSRMMFQGGETEVDEIMAEKVKEKDEVGDREWFWKDGIGGYEKPIKERIKKDDMKEVVKDEVEDSHVDFSSGYSSIFFVRECYLPLTDGRVKIASLQL